MGQPEVWLRSVGRFVCLTLALIARQHLPPGHDDMVENLKGEVFGLHVVRLRKDLVDYEPRIGILLELVERGLGILLLERGKTTCQHRSGGGREGLLDRGEVLYLLAVAVVEGFDRRVQFGDGGRHGRAFTRRGATERRGRTRKRGKDGKAGRIGTRKRDEGKYEGLFCLGARPSGRTR